jgi:hypothetical protein
LLGQIAVTCFLNEKVLADFLWHVSALMVSCLPNLSIGVASWTRLSKILGHRWPKQMLLVFFVSIVRPSWLVSGRRAGKPADWPAGRQAGEGGQAGRPTGGSAAAKPASMPASRPPGLPQAMVEKCAPRDGIRTPLG